MKRRRVTLLTSAVVTIAAGLAVHYLLTGAAADFTADALYAVLVFLVIALLTPSLAGTKVAALAFGLCAAIELFQLTGIPSDIVAHFPLAALLLGSTFAPIDLLAYALGAATAATLDHLARARTGRPPA